MATARRQLDEAVSHSSIASSWPCKSGLDANFLNQRVEWLPPRAVHRPLSAGVAAIDLHSTRPTPLHPLVPEAFISRPLCFSVLFLNFRKSRCPCLVGSVAALALKISDSPVYTLHSVISRMAPGAIRGTNHLNAPKTSPGATVAKASGKLNTIQRPLASHPF